jgi:hypothetical protein
MVVGPRCWAWLRRPGAAGFREEQFSGGYWRLVSAFTPDSKDEGHPLPAASAASSRRSPTVLAQVVLSPAPVLQPLGAPLESWRRMS